jgi:hypothetical protein
MRNLLRRAASLLLALSLVVGSTAPAAAQLYPNVTSLKPPLSALAGDEVLPIYQGGQLVQTTLAAACSTKAAATASSVVGLPAAGPITGSELVTLYQGASRVVTSVNALCSTKAAFPGAFNVVGLPGAGPLTGGELLPVFQNGHRRAITVDQLASVGGGGVTPVAFANFSKVKAKRAANQRAIIAMLGDSLFAGWGADSVAGGGAGTNAGQTPNNNRSNYSTPAQVAAQLKAAGIPARSDAIFGSGGVQSSVVSYFNTANPVFQIGSGGAISSQPETMGGPMIRTDAAGTTVGVFNPQELTDKLEIWFITGTTNQVLTATDSDGVIGTYDVGSSSGGGIRKITISRTTPSIKPITITQGTAVAGCYFLALIPYNSLAPMVEVWNWGRGGWKASDALVSTNAWSPGSMLPTYNPDAVIISFGANDANGAVPASTFQSNLQSLVTLAAPASRDVRLVKQHGTVAGGETGYDAPSTFRIAIDSVTTSNTLRAAFNFHDGILATPADYFDSIHLNRGGYAKEATVVSADMLATN